MRGLLTKRSTRLRLCGKATRVSKPRAISARISERQTSRPQTICAKVACCDGNSPLVTDELNLWMRLRRMSSLLGVNGFWSTHSYHKEALFFTGHDSVAALGPRRHRGLVAGFEVGPQEGVRMIGHRDHIL